MKNALCNLSLIYWALAGELALERNLTDFCSQLWLCLPLRSSALLNLDMADQPEMRIYCEFDGVAPKMRSGSGPRF